MTKSKPVKTGIDELDNDLKLFFEVVESDRRQDMIAALADSTLSKDALLKRVPARLIRLLVGLTSTAAYRSLLNRSADEAKPTLENARRIAEEHFGAIQEHPATMAVLEEEAGESSEDDPKNVIMSLGWESEWSGKPPELEPSTRVVLRGRGDKILLPCVLDWDDLSFLTKSFARILAKHMENALPLAEQKLLRVPKAELIAKRIQETQSILEKITQLAPELGISFPEGADESGEAAVED